MQPTSLFQRIDMRQPKEDLMRNSEFIEFIRLVVNGDPDEVLRRLADPTLATAAAEIGASRQNAGDFFIKEIAHYVYAGDTALHMAAAAFRSEIAKILLARGADCRARNRRGAEPLHYAADTNHWNPEAQSEMIALLLSAGADPNASDANGATPLHRAVRTRSLPAVRTLLDGGAEPSARNKSGSTPLHLAVQTTGRSGSGSEHPREQQTGIIKLLLERGAGPNDRDGRGVTVLQATRTGAIRELLIGVADP